MILQALIAYAEREGLGDADFEPVGVRWQIPLTADGRLSADPISLVENPGEKKQRPKRLVRPKSDPDFVSHGRAYFLCDTLERSTVFLDDDAKTEKRRINQAYYVALLEEAAKDCPAHKNSLLVVVGFLRDETQTKLLHQRLLGVKAKTSENAVFAVDGVSLLEMPDLKSWWRKKNQQQRSQQEVISAVCLATGKVDAICRTTGFIKLLGEETKLISFNKECPAFESYDLSQAANAAIGVGAEENVRAALNTLIEKSRDQNLVFNDTAYLHWTREPIAHDPLDLLTTSDPDGVAHLLQSIRGGERQVGFDTNAYYCLGLSGNGARIVVRDWLETTVGSVQKAVAAWFDGSEIIDPDGVSLRSGHKFGAILYAMVRAELDELQPALPAALFYAILRGAPVPLPRTALAAALRRQSLDQRKPDDQRDPRLNPARLGLIRAVLNRLPDQSIFMTKQLDPACSNSAYLCGRLFAVFDRLQYLAQGQLNAGISERFYASACVTPSLVMGRLFRNAQFHLAKAGGGIAENIRKDFEEITTALGDEFPPTLTLEEQGRFALGFYHQKADYRRISTERRDERDAAKLAAATA